MENIFTKENVLKAQEVLLDNGIEEGESGIILQAIGYAFDVELEDLIDWKR